MDNLGIIFHIPPFELMPPKLTKPEKNFNGSDPNGSLTLPDSNLFLCPCRSVYIETNPGWLELPLAGKSFKIYGGGLTGMKF